MQAGGLIGGGERLSCSAATAPPLCLPPAVPPATASCGLPKDPTANNRAALESAYLTNLRSGVAIAPASETLRKTILALIAAGLAVRDLVSLAANAGFPEAPVRKLISKVLLDAGVRRRKAGAGPRTPPEALAIASDARTKFGSRAAHLLGAAQRVCRTQDQIATRAAARAAVDSLALSSKG